MSLIQSDADRRYLIEHLDTSGYSDTALNATGERDVDGVKWVVFTGAVPKEPVWVTPLDGPTGPVRIAITGAGDVDDYRTLAAAIQTESPLPK